MLLRLSHVSLLAAASLISGCGVALDYVLTGEWHRSEDTPEEGAVCAPLPDETFIVNDADKECLADVPLYQLNEHVAIVGKVRLFIPKATQGAKQLVELTQDVRKMAEAFGSAQDIASATDFDASALFSEPELPEGLEYVGDGVYRWKLSEVLGESNDPLDAVVEFTFQSGEDYAELKKGDTLEYDLFRLDSYIQAGILVGTYPKFDLKFVKVGPLFPLLGLGEEIPSPLVIDAEAPKDLMKEFLKLEVTIKIKATVVPKDECWELEFGADSSQALFVGSSSDAGWSFGTPVLTGLNKAAQQEIKLVKSTLKLLKSEKSTIGDVDLSLTGLELHLGTNLEFDENGGTKSLVSCATNGAL
jgi:hypothetical protein